MQWNDHWRIEGQHAYLGASRHHWINYDEVKLRHNFDNHMKAQEGTELHELAKALIKKRIKLRGSHTLAAYVNDAIGFRMDPEVPLVYNEDFFGTPDAIKYEPRTKILRIHDLKTGTHPGHFNQLYIYAVLFFLEYGKLLRVQPHDVKTILRIYQNDEVFEEIADPDKIVEIREKGKAFAKLVSTWKEVVS